METPKNASHRRVKKYEFINHKYKKTRFHDRDQPHADTVWDNWF